jgi:hypothetical protein
MHFHCLICKPLNLVVSHTNFDNWKFLFSIFSEDRRGDFVRHKRKHLELHAMNVEKEIRCLSNQKMAILFTAARASQNTFHINESLLGTITVSIRKTRGQDVDRDSKEKRRKSPPAFSRDTSPASMTDDIAVIPQSKFWKFSYFYISVIPLRVP